MRKISKADMPCNKPTKSSRPGKKKVVKACEGGKRKDYTLWRFKHERLHPAWE